MSAAYLVPSRERIQQIRKETAKNRKRKETKKRVEGTEKGSKWPENFQHRGELRCNIRYTTAACAPTNPHFPLRWPSRRLCFHRANSLVTLIGFSHESAPKQLI